MKIVETSCLIEAPIEVVWKIMTEIRYYPDWNPFVVSVEADQDVPEEGLTMLFDVRWRNGKGQKSKELVALYRPPSTRGEGVEARWDYRFDGWMHDIGMVRAVRTQQLVAVSDNTTRYYTAETFKGWGKWLLPYEKVKEGFEDQAAALKEQSEKQ